MDTGVFYALYDAKDVNHLDSLAIVFRALRGHWGRVFLTNYIVLETTLLLASRISANLARKFVDFVAKSGIVEIVVDEPLYLKALERFRRDVRLSLTDAVTLEALGSLEIRWLATFDTKSFSSVKNVVGKGSWVALSDREKREARALIQH